MTSPVRSFAAGDTFLTGTPLCSALRTEYEKINTVKERSDSQLISAS
jgi:hypothetical protein